MLVQGLVLVSGPALLFNIPPTPRCLIEDVIPAYIYIKYINTIYYIFYKLFLIYMRTQIPLFSTMTSPLPISAHNSILSKLQHRTWNLV